MDYNKLAKKVAKIAKRASKIYYKQDFFEMEERHKYEKDDVTNNDVATQNYLQYKLSQLIPNSGFIGEEGCSSNVSDNGYVWIIDPIDGTSCVAGGRPNGIAAVGISLAGTMFDPGHSYYCEKLVVGPEAANVIDLDAPVKDNLINVAKALGKKVGDLKVFVLDKPRHDKLINDIHNAGARVMVHSDGDIAGALMAVDPTNDIDMLIGIGGTPEAVVTACAIKGTGGQMLTRLAPKTEQEREAIIKDGVDLKAIRSIDELVTTDQCFFAATGVTPGELLDGVKYKGGYAITSSISSRGRTGTRRYIQAWHDRTKLSKMSTIEY